MERLEDAEIDLDKEDAADDLLFNEVEGLHFYTLNKSKATVEICKRLGADHAH